MSGGVPLGHLHGEMQVCRRCCPVEEHVGPVCDVCHRPVVS